MTDKERSGRDKLIEAIRISERNYCDKFPLANGEIQYSEDYLRDMDSVLKKSRNPIQKYFDTGRKRVAAAVIVAATIGGSMMSISAVREPVVEFITNVYEKFVDIFFDEKDIAKAPETIETIYTIGCVPKGYEVFDVRIDENKVFWVWKNQNGDYIEFLQSTLDGSTLMDTEESNYTIFYLEDTKVAYNEKYGIKTYFWNSHEYAFSIVIKGEMSNNECIELIETLTYYNY